MSCCESCPTGKLSLVVGSFNEYDCKSPSCYDTDADSGGDSLGDYCNVYTAYPEYCGFFDTADFSSGMMCCACGGGKHCYDTDAGSGGDSYGDYCNIYTAYPEECGGYDTADFSSGMMCCACGGGKDCYDTDAGSGGDSDGDYCNVYTSYPEYCGGYDTANFSSGMMCCACGGGNTISVPISTEAATTTSTEPATTTSTEAATIASTEAATTTTNPTPTPTPTESIVENIVVSGKIKLTVSIENCNDSSEMSAVSLVARTSMATTLGYDDVSYIVTVAISCASRRTRFLASQENLDWDFRVDVPASYANDNSVTSDTITTSLAQIETTSANTFANAFVSNAVSNGNLPAQNANSISSSLDTEDITVVSDGMDSDNTDDGDDIRLIIIAAAAGGGIISVIMLFVTIRSFCRKGKVHSVD